MFAKLPGLSTNEDAHANRVVQLDEGFLASYKIPVCPFSANVHVVSGAYDPATFNGMMVALGAA